MPAVAAQAQFVGTYTIFSANNRLKNITGSQARTYTYNAVGSVTGDGSKTFAYRDNERLKSATVAGSTWTYFQNGLGERVRKKLAPSGNHYYAYDEAGHLVGEYNGNTLIQETVWLGDIPVATLRGTSIFYVHTDHLNAPTKVTQPSNNSVRWSWDRDPFGTTAPNENPAGLGAFSYNLRLPGQFYDVETGLHYNYYRDYDPSIGRYVQSDPIGLKGGINTYAYVGDSPISNIDPYGLYCLSNRWINLIAGGLGGAFAGGATGAAAGPPSALAFGLLGAISGASLGYFTTPSVGSATALGAATGAAANLNHIPSGALGGVVGGYTTHELQRSGVPDSAAALAGGATGGFTGGFLSGWLRNQAWSRGAAGGLAGLSGAAVSAAIAEGLKAGNDCPCGQ